MRFSTRIAKIIFFTTALLLLVIATILYIQVKDLVNANGRVNHTNEVKLNLAQTLSSFKDAESAQRGYMLTQDSLFLQPYRTSFDKANKSINKLEQLSRNNVEQTENLKKLDAFVKLRYSTFYTIIDSFMAEKSVIAREQILLKEKSLMDSIRMQIDRMENIETGLLEKNVAVQIQREIMAPVATVILVFVSLAVLAFSYYRITLDLKLAEKHVQEMNALNAQLIEKNRQLEITNEELDSFNYITSHDLQEPVRKIRTFISIIEETDYDKLSEKNKYNFNRIQAAAVRIQELLNDLLTYSQINKKHVDFVDVDLNQVVEKVKNKMSDDIERGNASIKHDHLPSIKGVPFQMEQLFEHLFSNALKYKKTETVSHIKIHYSMVPGNNIDGKRAINSDKYHKIVFEDNGIGFEQEQAFKMFELFAQLHNKEYGGTGIGLTICKKIVQNHNGFIKAKGQVNEGAIFEIYLPA